MKSQRGFTLVELVVVCAIIGILLAIVTYNFTRLSEKTRVESTTKEIYNILMKARNTAATTNTTNLVVLAANQVQTGADANGDGNIDANPAITNYPSFIINFAATPVIFDRRGLTTNIQTISLTGYSAGTTPAMDCLVVSFTRINIGLMTGGACVQQ